MIVLVADDNAVVRIGLGRILSRMNDVEHVLEASNGKEAIATARETQPDVVLLDVRMPVMGGLEALPILAETAKVIMLTSDDDTETITSAIGNGASGYLVHGSLDAEQITGAITTCIQGGLVLGPEAAGQLALQPLTTCTTSTNPLLEVLTAREADVLEAASRGQSNAQIAKEQFLSPRTVKNYLNSAYVKLGVHNRAEAIVRWREAIGPQQR
ncbi:MULTISPECIES: response regulator transcription factor [Actinomyces]|uniref:DNA-binding response regulator n=1 Tax=Actinomyces oris TaxID=544580 RepID=A0A1Q8VRN8_9ACTO|nr:response regulator transcription factor [Actinomyces oris]OLO50751.1 hypothetical protein BKH28_02730 [Actinomyces oris]